MPGQQLVAPHMTSEALAAQTSPQARRRRTTRLMKTGSFCSITSEGDGDIFSDEACGGCGPSPASIISQPRGSTSSSGKFDPLSDYSEWQNEDTRSDISELFLKEKVTNETSPLLEPEQPQETFVSATGSLEEITYEVPINTVTTPKLTQTTSEVNLEAEVSSVSLSIGKKIKMLFATDIALPISHS